MLGTVAVRNAAYGLLRAVRLPGGAPPPGVRAVSSSPLDSAREITPNPPDEALQGGVWSQL
eukprot:15028101-Alexandrium_andersonii.AAC.1